MSLAAFLTAVARVLEESGAAYMVTGSLAAAYYALPRATQDVDLVVEVSADQLDTIVDGLLARGFYVDREAAHDALRTGGQFNAIDTEHGWKADLIVRKDRPFSREEFSRRRPVTLLGIDVSLTTLEDLILAKLEWGSIGDSELQRRDLLQLLETGWAALDRAYVERWVDELGLRAEWEALLEKLRPVERGPRSSDARDQSG